MTESSSDLMSLPKEELCKRILAYNRILEECKLFRDIMGSMGFSFSQLKALSEKLKEVEEAVHSKKSSISDDDTKKVIQEKKLSVVLKFIKDNCFNIYSNDVLETELIDCIGENEWKGLSVSSKENLITALLLKKEPSLPDCPSLICISFSKPVEREIKKYFFKKYRLFLIEEYKECSSNWPSGMKKNNNMRKENDFSLGATPLIVGINLKNNSPTIDYSEFCHFMEIEYGFSNKEVYSFAKYVAKFANDLIPYRNPASHGSEDYVTRDMATKCENLVLGEKGISKLLKYALKLD